MKYTTLIFDCDGTLLDTLTDLANAVNYALKTHQFPTRTVDEIRSDVGNGVANLMRQSLPHDVCGNEFKTYLHTFESYYSEHLQDYTVPYEGILDVVDTLKEQGYKLAIVSNKVQEGVTPLNKQYFGDRFPIAIGHRADINRKPAPDMVFQALQELGSTPEESIYIGDSEVDVATARNSGLLCIGVTWGFRDESVHQELGVQHIARIPKDILTIVDILNA